MRALIRTLPLVAAVILPAGCMVGPDYVRPAVRVPAAYRENRTWKLAAPADHLPRSPWWEVFGDPQLNALEAQVAVSNQNAQAAAAQLRQSQALVQQARTGLFPSLSGDASVVRSQSTIGGGQVPVSIGGPTVTTHSFALSLPWEIDLWGRVRRQVEANEAGAQASAADLESVLLSAQANLAQDYFLLRLADARKRLLDRTVAAYKRALEITENRYAAGVVSKVDVVQADTQLKTTQAQAIEVGVQRAQLEHAIAVLIGRPPATFELPPGIQPAKIPPIPTGVPSQLLERRPDIASAERRVAAANAEIGVAKAAFFPTLSLSASGGYQGTDFSKVLSAGNRFWSLGPALAGTLFDAGLRRAQTAQAVAAYDASVANYRQTVLAGFQEVEDNLATLRILAQEAAAQDAAVAAARRSVQLNLNQYKAGTVSYLNVVTAQATQLSSELTAVNLQGRRLTASVLLIKALGGGWHQPKANIPDARPIPAQALVTATRASSRKRG
ncbi:MAG: efflux transporter outer membrane subunit [Chromatiaceae bacterium]